MKVVSLFDGIACGLTALKKVFKTEIEYHAFEIDKNAIKCALSNHPEIIEHGSVINADFSKFTNVDLLIGGSPCQDFSRLGKRNGFNGENGKLFFEFVRALQEIKPKYFIFENVVDKKAICVFAHYLQSFSIVINSKFFSPQNRNRVYFTNFEIPSPIIENSLLLKDIITFQGKNVTEKVKLYLSDNYKGRRIQQTVSKSIIENFEQKSRTITKMFNFGSTNSMIFKKDNEYYLPCVEELEKLQTLPVGYTRVLTYNQAVSAIGNGWNINTICYILYNLQKEFYNEKIKK